MFFDDINDEDEDFFGSEDDFQPDEVADEMSQQIYDRMIDRYVRTNYEAIENKGIDIQGLRIISMDNGVLVQLKSTIQFMIQYFIEREEYEKCAVLNKYLPELEDILTN
jgi:hypothetical protein